MHVIESQDEVDAAVIERQPLWNNRKRETGPFDASTMITAVR